MGSTTETLCWTHQSTEDEVVDHKSDGSAVPKSEGTFPRLRGLSKAPMGQPKEEITEGWSLLVELSKGTPEWMKFSDLKESHPVEVVKSARDRGLIDEPAFA